jgi:phosphoribosylglycinamide formyltransferase-1
MLKIGVLVSGGGSNLQAIIDAIDTGYIQNAEIVAVISNVPSAFGIERAKTNNIPAYVVRKKDYKDISEFDNAIIENFEKHEVDLVLMAGFLAIVGEKLVNKYEGRMMNIHPSLIPAFCGAGYYGLKVHEKVLEYGVKVTGATVHFVTLDADTGPIIIQKAVEIEQEDTAEILQKRVMENAEWVIYKEAVRLFVENKLKIEGNKVIIEM